MKKKINFNAADFEPVNSIALRFPGAEASVSHEGTPSVKVRGQLLCRLHDNGEYIPIRLDSALRDHYLEKYPEIFHLPEHFKNYPYICLWIQKGHQQLLTEVLEHAWKLLASKQQLLEWAKQKK